MKTGIVYSEKYYVDIGMHVFPTAKYRFIKDRLKHDPAMVNKIAFVEPEEASRDDVLRVHTEQYVEKLMSGTLSPEEKLTLELPFSRELARASFLSCGGTVKAAEIALEDGLGIHLGGGFHHAFPDHGEGFCVLNDIAVAIKKAIFEKKIKRALVVDCDLHQGNGTAYIFRNDKHVFTFSIHQENNYPFYKPPGDLDIGLPDRTRDREYLAHLEKHLARIIVDFRPDFIIYVAGADPYEHDQIGNLALTVDGLRERDVFVCSQARNFRLPIAIVLAGGYAVNLDDTVRIQYNTVTSAVETVRGKQYA